MLGNDFGTGQVFYSFLWFTMFFIWIWLLIIVFSDIFRSHDLGGFVSSLDHLRDLSYLGVFVPDRPGSQDERKRDRGAAAQDAAQRPTSAAR